jgi:hypothetical protein
VFRLVLGHTSILQNNINDTNGFYLVKPTK